MRRNDGEIKYISYERFGRLLIEHTVTSDKVEAALSGLSHSSFDFGPLQVGPMGLAGVSAQVDLGEVEVARKLGIDIRFEIVIPLKVKLKVDLTVDSQEFEVEGNVHVRLRVLTAEPLRLIVRVEEPRTRDVKIDVSHAGVRGALIRIFAFVDNQVKKFVVRYIKEEINKPEILEARDIDIAARIDAAWAAEMAARLAQAQQQERSTKHLSVEDVEDDDDFDADPDQIDFDFEVIGDDDAIEEATNS